MKNYDIFSLTVKLIVEDKETKKIVFPYLVIKKAEFETVEKELPKSVKTYNILDIGNQSREEGKIKKKKRKIHKTKKLT